ncbi:MAG: SHOCT domain-containing protein [Actinobacteria bacterium]|nr:SHOCT domain-containing protein [Actinomycetota bacterium]
MQGAHVGASTGPRTADPSERLRELAAMRDQGLITAEDFEAKKAEILRDL